MKALKFNLLGGIILLCLSMMFASCEGTLDDVFGEWSKPAPSEVPSTVVEDARVLGAALETGATVTINYTVGGNSYVAVFKKESDDTYTLISNSTPSATRGMTRSIAPDPSYTVPTGDAANATNIQLTLEGDKLVFTVIDATNGAHIFKAYMDVAGGEVTVVNINADGLNCKIGSVSVNGESKEIKNSELQSVNITYSYLTYAVKFSEGDTWADVVDRFKDIEQVEITTTTDGYISVEFSSEMIADMLKAAGVTDETDISNETSNFSGSFYLYTKVSMSARAMTRAISYNYTPVNSTDAVVGSKIYILGPTVPHALASAVVGEIVGRDGKAYAASDKDKMSAIDVPPVAMVAYKSETAGSSLAIALEDVSSNKLSWDNTGGNNSSKTAAEWCSEWNTSKPITGGTWQLPSKDQWNNMINGLGGANSLQTKVDLASDDYWSSTEHESNPSDAYRYNFGLNGWYQANRNSPSYVRACLAF